MPQGFLFIAGVIIGFAITIYLFMQGSIIAAILLLLTIVLFSRVPVFLAVGILGTVGLFLAMGPQGLVQISQVVFSKLNSFPLTCLPLFVFAGIIMERGKLVDDLFKFVEVWIGHYTPSILVVTIIVGMIICSGVYPFLTIYPPFFEIITGIVFGGQVMALAEFWPR